MVSIAEDNLGDTLISSDVSRSSRPPRAIEETGGLMRDELSQEIKFYLNRTYLLCDRHHFSMKSVFVVLDIRPQWTRNP